MRLPAVDLDDETLIAPKEIDQEAIESNVHFRLGKAVATTQGEELRLQLTAGVVWCNAVVEGQAQVLGLAKGGYEFSAGENSTQIRQRPGRLRHRDAGPTRYICWGKGEGSMEADSVASLSAGVTRDSDLNQSRCGPKAPKGRRASMAEHHTGAAGQNRRHPSPLIADFGVADGVDPTVNAVQAAGG